MGEDKNIEGIQGKMLKKTKVHSYGENYGINILIVRLNFKWSD